MKNLFLPAAILFSVLFSSCSTYQINMLSSTNTVKDEKTGVFNVENDSVKISYSFYGDNAPINIQVLNKSDKPLYIDWQSSALVIDGHTYSYVNQNVPITGAINGTTSTYNTGNRRASGSIFPGKISTSSASVDAVVQLPSNTTFLPPHAQSNNMPLNLISSDFSIDEGLMHKEKINYSDGFLSKPVDINTVDFTKETSPLVFKSYLTLYTINHDLPKRVLYEHEFYVSKVISTLKEPVNLQDFKVQRGDYFINSRPATLSIGRRSVAPVSSATATGGSSNNSSNNQ